MQKVMLLLVVCGLMMAPQGLAQSSILNLIQQLSSPEWAQRSDALDQLSSQLGSLQQPSVQTAILRTLDNENGLTVTAFRQSGGTQSTSDIYGEDYDEYYGKLMNTALTFANLSDPNTVRILAQGSYNPDSKVAKQLTKNCPLLVPILVEESTSDVAVIRQTNLDFISYILHTLKPVSLNSAAAGQLIQVLQSGLSDPDPATRVEANAQLKNLADVNSDGVVNCADIAIVKASFGKKTGQAGFDPRADVNLDGIVDIRDLAFVSQHLPAGTKCP